jgi:hypothetical protein
MAELNFKSACELTALIRKRDLKPSEAVAHALARVESLNGKLNAFCAMRAERAMAEARAMDERVARREEVGALAGVPIGVKDLEEVAGMATTFGSKAFRDNLAVEDAIEVARLRAAGAIVIGKTNTPEFGHSAFTRNLLFGLTRNPWNLERTRRADRQAAARRRWQAGWFRSRPRQTPADRSGCLPRTRDASDSNRRMAGFRLGRGWGWSRSTASRRSGRSRARLPTPHSFLTWPAGIMPPTPTRYPIRASRTSPRSSTYRRACASRFIPTSATP